jgi:hypothetical protein
MGMNLPNPKAVLANEAFPKGSPRPDFFSTLNRPRHRQAGCKNFRAETFDVALSSRVPSPFSGLIFDASEGHP